MWNFLNPETVRDADAARRDANGDSVALDAIRKALCSPLHGDPVGLAKNAKSRRDEDDMDTDEDMTLTTEERNDLRARRKAKKAADKTRGNVDAARKAIASIHSRGAAPFDPDWLRKAQDPDEREDDSDDRPSVQAIRKAQQRPLCMHPSANVPINEADIQRLIAQGKAQMRKGTVASFKPSLPRQSHDATSDTQPRTLYGATNDWPDIPTPWQPFSATMGGFTDSQISPRDARIRAAIAEASGNSGRDASVAAIQMDWKRKKEQMAASFASRPAARTGDDTTKSVPLRDLGARVGDDLRKAFRM
jgi:hypothetical protein